MILVSGAHGQLGSGILAQLRAQGIDAVGGSRTTADGIRQLDFDEPTTLDLTGVETLVMVSAGYAEDDRVVDRHGAVIDAAVRDGVGHLVYTSLIGDGDHLAFALAHRATERLIRDSGLGWTILRNGLYAELFGSLLTWTADGTLESAFGTGALAAVARADLAAAAAVVATAPSVHAHKIYELTGPPITADQVADRLGTTHRTVDLGTYRARVLAVDGLLPFQPPMLVSIATSIRHGFLADPSPDLEKLLGRPVTDPLTVAAELTALLRPSPARAPVPS
ncbi:NAD(P)H-binding protein [Nocardia sp. NPDC058176]|uniref:NAD(P)H-binding protein n=1 Tax=Nocardia sp. NPDC058176 TaxID=3346368 RepID=UPI0036DBC133